MPRTLRARLNAPGLVVAPGCHDALGARILEQAGFEAVYMTGNGLSAAMLGAPDLGLLTLTEMASRARAIAASISVPLIADADTGYGNLNNVARTIAEYEAAGVAALHLEDQVTPKKCGAMSGLSLVPAEEHAEKIRHAVKIDLPHASSQKEETKPAQVTVNVLADGTVLWDETPVSDDALRAKIAAAAQVTPQPELHLNADRKVAYEKVADVMSAAQAGGLTKIGFVTEPKK